MRYAVSLPDLRRAGLVLTADEAVAIALQLIHPSNDSPAQPPFGPPATARIRIADDGVVRCDGWDATPTVAELAILLDDLLSKTRHVPGGLRYTIARALHEVDAPPFDSLEEFAAALARYAPQRPHDAVRRLAARSDRRRPASPSELRHQLREADRRLYEYKGRVEEQPRPQRRVHGWVAGAVVAAALTTIAAASVVGDRAPDMPPAPAPPPATHLVMPEAVTEPVHPILAAPVVHARRANPKPPVRAQATRTLRLRLFHKTIAIKDDLTRP